MDPGCVRFLEVVSFSRTIVSFSFCFMCKKNVLEISRSRATSAKNLKRKIREKSEREDSKIDKLKEHEDWNMWKFQLTVLLRAHDVYSVVNGETLKPDEGQIAQVATFQRKLKEWY